MRAWMPRQSLPTPGTNCGTAAHLWWHASTRWVGAQCAATRACAAGCIALDATHPFPAHPQLFANIARFHADTLRFLGDLDSGAFVACSVEELLRRAESRQLLLECCAFCAALPLLLDARVEGRVRERLVVAHLRFRGTAESEVPYVEQVVRVARTSGYSHAQPALRPRGYPEEYLARFPLPPDLLQLLLGRLRLEDVYGAQTHWPSPAHRGTALALQGAHAFLLLFLAPQVLREDGPAMRELTDRHFADAWVVPWAPGHAADLSVWWEPYRAARSALETAAPPAAARRLAERHAAACARLCGEVPQFLAEGVLDDEFLLSNHEALFSCVRDANCTARWLLLHAQPPWPPPTRPGAPPAAAPPPGRLLAPVASRAPPLNAVVLLLLHTAALEEALSHTVARVVDAKGDAWAAARTDALARIDELAAFYGGGSLLTRALRDDALHKWFTDLSAALAALDPSRPLATGRKLQQMVAALTEVEGFRAVDTSLASKAYLAETRVALSRLLRMLHVGPGSLAMLAALSDAGWAWGPAQALVPLLRQRLSDDPAVVHQLRCLFLKLRTLMELPLLRPGQAASADTFSLSQFYSSLLVDYAASVLEVVPARMFEILTRSIAVHAGKLLELPTRLEKTALKDHAQLEERYALAEATHAVAVFTQGIFAMERTFMGVIELDPRQLLERGVRQQVCAHISAATAEELVFAVAQAGYLSSSSREATLEEFEGRLESCAARLGGLKASFEYIQDFVNVTGLSVWHAELGRVAADAASLECGAVRRSEGLRAHAAAEAPASDSEASGSGEDDGDGADATHRQGRVPRHTDADGGTWLGRLCSELRRHTSPLTTVYLPSHPAWHVPVDGVDAAKEVVGLRMAASLHAAIGLPGIAALDRLLTAQLTARLRCALRHAVGRLDAGSGELSAAAMRVLGDAGDLPDTAPSFYGEAAARLGRSVGGWATLGEPLADAGQLLLLRRLLAGEAARTAEVDAQQLSAGVAAACAGAAEELRFRSGGGCQGVPAAAEAEADLRADLASLALSTGQADPLRCGYLSPRECSLAGQQAEALAQLLFLFTASQLPRYVVDKRLALLRPARRHAGAAPDATPLLAGLALLLTAAGPCATRAYVARLAQYCRTHTQVAAAALAAEPHAQPCQPGDLIAALAWLQALIRLGALAQRDLDQCLPSWVMHTLLAAAPQPRR